MPSLRITLSDDREVTHDLTEDKTTVGRLADNAIQIDDASISSHHAELTLEGGECRLNDLGSTNGTFVNEEQATDSVLRHGDQVRFGKVEAEFLSEAASGETAPPPETSDAKAETGSSSTRPVDFKNSSPFPKETKYKDPLAVVAMILAVIGCLGAVAAAVFALFLLEPPRF